MKKVLRFVFGRFFITSALIILQSVFILLTVFKAASCYVWINAALSVTTAAAVIFLTGSDENSSYKSVWLLTMLIFPLSGGIMFFIAEKGKDSRLKKLSEKYGGCRENNTVTKKGGISDYIAGCGGFPVFTDTSARYFSCGEEFIGALAEELSGAEEFIFLEFFLIADGRAWDMIWDILCSKAAAGVEIKIIYDDLGSICELPAVLGGKELPANISAAAFNPFVPLISAALGFRDHRKIAVIDGRTAFTGGINIADEYMNMKPAFGYWKDTAVMVSGGAVSSFTEMFVRFWNFLAKDNNEKLPHEKYIRGQSENSSGKTKVQPFADSPFGGERISENIYIDIISRSEKYVYIFTPYLMIDDQLKNALTLAAGRGVDVRIVTPGIPDKKTVFGITRSYYRPLVNAGVKIYEFSPGFIHAKSIVSDDRAAAAGSVNLDFRSLYLHFECGVYFESGENGAGIIEDMRRDCISIFNLSREVLPEECGKYARLPAAALLRAIAPLA